MSLSELEGMNLSEMERISLSEQENLLTDAEKFSNSLSMLIRAAKEEEEEEEEEEQKKKQQSNNSVSSSSSSSFFSITNNASSPFPEFFQTRSEQNVLSTSSSPQNAQLLHLPSPMSITSAAASSLAASTTSSVSQQQQQQSPSFQHETSKNNPYWQDYQFVTPTLRDIYDQYQLENRKKYGTKKFAVTVKSFITKQFQFKDTLLNPKEVDFCLGHVIELTDDLTGLELSLNTDNPLLIKLKNGIDNFARSYSSISEFYRKIKLSLPEDYSLLLKKEPENIRWTDIYILEPFSQTWIPLSTFFPPWLRDQGSALKKMNELVKHRILPHKSSPSLANSKPEKILEYFLRHAIHNSMSQNLAQLQQPCNSSSSELIIPPIISPPPSSPSQPSSTTPSSSSSSLFNLSSFQQDQQDHQNREQKSLYELWSDIPQFASKGVSLKNIISYTCRNLYEANMISENCLSLLNSYGILNWYSQSRSQLRLRSHSRSQSQLRSRSQLRPQPRSQLQRSSSQQIQLSSSSFSSSSLSQKEKKIKEQLNNLRKLEKTIMKRKKKKKMKKKK